MSLFCVKCGLRGLLLKYKWFFLSFGVVYYRENSSFIGWWTWRTANLINSTAQFYKKSTLLKKKKKSPSQCPCFLTTLTSMNSCSYWLHLISQLPENLLLKCSFSDAVLFTAHSQIYTITCVCLLVTYRPCCSFDFQLVRRK